VVTERIALVTLLLSQFLLRDSAYISIFGILCVRTDT